MPSSGRVAARLLTDLLTDGPIRAVLIRISHHGPTRESPGQRHVPSRPGMSRHPRKAAHNPKVAGSNPAPATNENAGQGPAAAGPSCVPGVGSHRVSHRRTGWPRALARAATPRVAFTSVRVVRAWVPKSSPAGAQIQSRGDCLSGSAGSASLSIRWCPSVSLFVLIVIVDPRLRSGDHRRGACQGV